MFNPVEQLKLVDGLTPTNGAGAQQTSDYFSVKNLHRAYIVCQFKNTTAAAVRLNVLEATAVAGTSAQAIANTQRIWSNLATATNDTLVERTAAVNYTTDAAAGAKMVVFEIDPSKLSEGFDCVAVQTNAALPNTDNLSVLFIGVPRYEARVATAPSIITD